MPLHPSAELMIQVTSDAGLTFTPDVEPATRRAAMIALATNPAIPKHPVHEVCDRTIPGPAGDLPVRLFRPSAAPNLPVLVWFHGGGWVTGNLETHDNLCRLLCDAADVLVVSVDYRLAPETPFPGPQEDDYAALEWLADNAAGLGVDPARIVVMGESAGGGLAAGLALMTRDRGGPPLAGQVLIYPMLDWRTGGPEDRHRNRHTGEFIWTREKNRFGWEALRGSYQPADARKGWFSPALADDLSGLAPAFISTGALDLFLDEDLDYARRLIDCGVPTELHVYPGAIHAFDMVPDTGLGAQAAMDLQRGLARLLGQGGVT